jgi:hypothetical protein
MSDHIVTLGQSSPVKTTHQKGECRRETQSKAPYVPQAPLNPDTTELKLPCRRVHYYPILPWIDFSG